MKKIDDVEVKTCRLSSFIFEESIQKFSSGKSIVDDFFKQEAVEFDEKNIVATTIYYNEKSKDIIGFYTVAAGTFTLNTNKFSRNRTSAPSSRESMESFPSINLNYLAVSKEYQNQRVGKAMVFHLFSDLAKVNYDHGVAFTCIFLQALTDAFDFYDRIGFELVHPEQEKLYLKSYDMIMSIDKLISVVPL